MFELDSSAELKSTLSPKVTSNKKYKKCKYLLLLDVYLDVNYYAYFYLQCDEILFKLTLFFSTFQTGIEKKNS